MCKLCNTDRKPYHPTARNYVEKPYISEFRKIMKDYSGELPCRNCVDNYSKSYRDKRSTSPDAYIVKNIVKHYSKHLTKEERKSAYSKANHTKVKRERLRVSRKIDKVINSDTGHISYRLFLHTSNKCSTKTFDSIDEAIYFRDNVELVPNLRFKPKFKPYFKKVKTGIKGKYIDTGDGVIVRYAVTWRSNCESYARVVDTLREANKLRRDKPHE